jgi:hypothetical protein
MNDLVVFSKNRKKPEFCKKQIRKNGYLIIDGKKICKTKCGAMYWFHLVDGKIDHWFVAPDDIPFPESCDACN